MEGLKFWYQPRLNFLIFGLISHMFTVTPHSYPNRSIPTDTTDRSSYRNRVRTFTGVSSIRPCSNSLGFQAGWTYLRGRKTDPGHNIKTPETLTGQPLDSS